MEQKINRKEGNYEQSRKTSTPSELYRSLCFLSLVLLFLIFCGKLMLRKQKGAGVVSSVKIKITRNTPKSAYEVARIGIEIEGYTRYPIVGVRLVASKKRDGLPWLAMPWANGGKLISLEANLESEIQDIARKLSEGESKEIDFPLAEKPTEWVYVNPFKSESAIKAMGTVTVKGLFTIKSCKLMEKADKTYRIVGPQYKMGDKYHEYFIATTEFAERINKKGTMGYSLKMEEKAKISGQTEDKSSESA